MRALYSALNLRRVAFSVTSVFGFTAGNEITEFIGHANLAPLG
jgi:hypothetical protein